MGRIQDKIVLITGASSRIAAACARIMTREGGRVILAGLDGEDGLEDAAGAPECVYRRLDVREEGQWQKLTAEIAAEYGRLDILVNNAAITGTNPGSEPLDPEHMSLETWRGIHRTNLDGVFLGCKHALKLMKATPGAAIVNVGSRSALVGRPARAAYASSKAAVRSVTRSIAMYCAEQGYRVRCNLVLPSLILTAMWDPVVTTGDERDGRIERLAGRVPLKRFGTPEEVAWAVLFLASEEASYITGAEIVIDGGLSVAPQIKPDFS